MVNHWLFEREVHSRVSAFGWGNHQKKTNFKFGLLKLKLAEPRANRKRAHCLTLIITRRVFKKSLLDSYSCEMSLIINFGENSEEATHTGTEIDPRALEKYFRAYPNLEQIHHAATTVTTQPVPYKFYRPTEENSDQNSSE